MRRLESRGALRRDPFTIHHLEKKQFALGTLSFGFEYEVVGSASGAIRFVEASARPSADVTLPAGKADAECEIKIRCIVTDSLGASTTAQDQYVRVELPELATLEQMEAYTATLAGNFDTTVTASSLSDHTEWNANVLTLMEGTAITLNHLAVRCPTQNESAAAARRLRSTKAAARSKMLLQLREEAAFGAPSPDRSSNGTPASADRLLKAVDVLVNRPEEVSGPSQSMALGIMGSVLGTVASAAEGMSMAASLSAVSACSSISDAFDIAPQPGDEPVGTAGEADGAAGDVASQIAALVDAVSEALLLSASPGERAAEINTPSIQMRLQRHSSGSAADAELAMPLTLHSADSSVSFDPPSDLGPRLRGNAGVRTKFVNLRLNPHAVAESRRRGRDASAEADESELMSGVMSLKYTTSNGTELSVRGLKKPFRFEYLRPSRRRSSPRADAPSSRAPFLLQSISEHAVGNWQGVCADLKGSGGAPCQELSNATLRDPFVAPPRSPLASSERTMHQSSSYGPYSHGLYCYGLGARRPHASKERCRAQAALSICGRRAAAHHCHRAWQAEATDGCSGCSTSP